MDYKSLGLQIRTTARVYEGSQKLRIGMANRLLAVQQDRAQAAPETIKLWEGWMEQFASVETEAAAEMDHDLELHPAWPWLQLVKGIGPTMATKIIGEIADISIANNVSQLWRFALGGVIDGEVERPVKREKLHYNKRLKSIMFNVAKQFLMANSQYAPFYYRAKEYYELNRDWTPLHRHLASYRKMNKIFLTHLWMVWRSEQGLPVRSPWIQEYGGHDSLIQPWDVIPEYQYKPAILMIEA